MESQNTKVLKMNNFFLRKKRYISVNELLKVNFDTQTVSARELHEQLKIGTRFNDWFPRMVEYGFEEEKDFYSKMSKTSETGGR